MAKRRTILIVPGGGATGSGPRMTLGVLREVLESFAPFNTSPDGSGSGGMGEVIGVGVLHGPGFRGEIPTTSDEVAQVIISITDEDFAFPVLMRMCKTNRWRMMDPDTGQTFG
jgi:hypothetical protein